jgi:hypothetical protein
MATADAFLALYVRDAEGVLVFFTRRTLDVEVAVDLTPETFAQAWRGAASANAPKPLRGLELFRSVGAEDQRVKDDAARQPAGGGVWNCDKRVRPSGHSNTAAPPAVR